MISLVDREILHGKKFENKFGASDVLPPKKEKPEDFQHLFEGKIDEDFLIGLSLTKKSLKVIGQNSICSSLKASFSYLQMFMNLTFL